MWGRRIAAVVVVAACGGATSSVGGADGGGGGGGSGDSGAGSDGSSGGTKPTVESLETCDAPGQCQLGAPGCCGLGCQTPDSQIIGIRRGAAQDLVHATCDETNPTACSKCARELPGYEQAFCRAGKCAVVDIRSDAISTCAKDTDCVLLYAECCQPCNGGVVGQVVAINAASQGDLTLQLCTGTETCDKCLPAFPGTMHAQCNQSSGHCEVVSN